MNGRTIDIEHAEKVSSLLRNALIIAGALATTAMFAYDKWSTPFTARVRSIYIDGEATQLTYRDSKPETNASNIGPLGTFSVATLRNQTGTSVSLEVRIPEIKNYDATNPKADDPKLFTIVDAQAGCSIDPKDISITNSGLLRTATVGVVTVSQFPPDCTLIVTIASTQITSNARVRNGRIEVFYDGKRAAVTEPIELFGPLARYIEFLEDGGAPAVLLAFLLPLLAIVFVIGGVSNLLLRAASRPEVATASEASANTGAATDISITAKNKPKL
jgi:hypothetical protein